MCHVAIYQYVNISFLQFFSQLSRHFCVDQKPFQIDPHTKVACTTHTHYTTHSAHLTTCVCVCVCVWELAFKAAINGKNLTIRCSKISNQSSPPPTESSCLHLILVFCCFFFESRLDFWYFGFLGSPSVSHFSRCVCV